MLAQTGNMLARLVKIESEQREVYEKIILDYRLDLNQITDTPLLLIQLSWQEAIQWTTSW